MIDITDRRPNLYLCSRTSTSMSDEKPCDAARSVRIPRVDVRGVDDPRKIPENAGTEGDWYRRGTNHRVENGRIMRDLGELSVWAVEVPDIQAFVTEHGPCVISRRWDGFFEIEIYDDYRE